MTDTFSAKLKEELWQKSVSIQKDCCKRSFFASLLIFKAREFENTVAFSFSDRSADISFLTLCRQLSLSVSSQNGAVLIAKNDAWTRQLRLLGIGEDTNAPPVFLCGECFGHFLRGVFLSCGTLADPNKSHHLSLFCKERSEAIKDLIEEHSGIRFKIGTRRNTPYLYLKSLSEIEDVLTLIGAGHITMELLNSDLEHSMRALVNRQNNFDTANLSRTLEWNRRVIDSIETLKKDGRFDALSPALKAVARARMRYPDDTLQKLGERLKPRLSKSGVYHRLKKLIDLAGE